MYGPLSFCFLSVMRQPVWGLPHPSINIKITPDLEAPAIKILRRARVRQAQVRTPGASEIAVHAAALAVTREGAIDSIPFSTKGQA
jgi:6,7-dimethyl-8-ribityllumazine synthase